MANILGLITVNTKTILEIDEDPRDSGVDAPIGSLAMVSASGTGQQYIKVGAGPTEWDACIQKGYVAQQALTPSDISNKYILLPGTPADPEAVLVDVLCGGGPATYGEDYVVNGRELNWSGLGLDLVLDADDAIRIFYVS